MKKKPSPEVILFSVGKKTPTTKTNGDSALGGGKEQRITKACETEQTYRGYKNKTKQE